MAEKLKALKRQGDNKPWLHIYDGIRFAIVVDNLESLKFYGDYILKFCKGSVINLKPKLGTSLLNITIQGCLYTNNNIEAH